MNIIHVVINLIPAFCMFQSRCPYELRNSAEHGNTDKSTIYIYIYICIHTCKHEYNTCSNKPHPRFLHVPVPVPVRAEELSGTWKY